MFRNRNFIILLCIILICVLGVLLFFETTNPEAGSELVRGILGR